MLSSAQFGHLAEELKPKGKEDGGFTVKHTTGYRPSSGHSVALAGSERDLPTEEATGPAIEDYAKRHNPSLSQRGRYLGGWSPGEGEEDHGRSYLDNSRVIKNRKKAAGEMVMENQKSMYNLDTGETIPNTIRQKPKTFTEPKGFDRPAFEREAANLYRKARGRKSLEADEATRAGR